MLMEMMGKVKNHYDELRELYRRHDTAGILDFLLKNKTEPRYSNLIAEANNSGELYGVVERYLSNRENLKNSPIISGEQKKSLQRDKPTILEQELTKRGIPTRKFRDIHGINPSKILEYKENPDGSRVYLCHEENPNGEELFYIIKANGKTSNWKEIIEAYKKQNRF